MTGSTLIWPDLNRKGSNHAHERGYHNRQTESRPTQKGRGPRRSTDCRGDDFARVAARPQTHAGPNGQDSRDYTGQCLAPRKTQRFVALYPPQDRRGHGRKPVACRGIPRSRAGNSFRHWWRGKAEVVYVSLFVPLRGEDVELVALLGVLVGAKHQRLAVRRELRKRGESAKSGHLLQAGAIHVDQEQFELAAVALQLVGGEQDLLAVGRESGRETGAAEIGEGLLIAAVGVGQHQFHLHRRGHIVRQQFFVLGELRGVLGISGAPDELFAVAREDRAAVVPR